ncbi:ribonuclease R [Buchnera aphidicola (Muscaphis stroyani)]|uniref:Ribonuclease R n=1 Tax=Buchnera aphidicola (Muscaphis stroyani) TaxID=1241869 RepID=A0A4D6Y4I3_9GAMM|nr:ribonuclease R [Buchnera aphidicola]QCI24596.1 ribonuclease R [Buchnera aphidicola (Muscaphis stroyani)]
MVVNPYQKKELKNRNLIPSRECIQLWLRQSKNPVNQKKIEKVFKIYKKEEKQALKKRLRSMEKDHQIFYTPNHCYANPEKIKIIQGKVIGHRDGYGFLRTETLKDDLWLSSQEMKLCIHGDFISAYIECSNKKGRNSAKILKILKPNKILIIGQCYTIEKKQFVIPNDTRFNFKISIIKSINLNIFDGSIVVVKLKRNLITNSKFLGIIVEILGKEMGTRLAIEIALRTHSIPYKWSKKIQSQLFKIPENIKNSFNFNNRTDLRHLPFFTIDEHDARDFDDAVFCRKKNNSEEGWDLWVAIADVSHYVRPHTALDKAALERGNSIYFPSLVIPMLPEKISVDLCSLNPYQERLCLICEMSLSKKGELIKYKHYEGIICSQGRFTYDEVFKIWNGDMSLRIKYKKILKYLDNLFSLQKILNQYNISKKGIYFENIEPKFILNSNFKIKKIYQNIRNDAHKFIESCMILANIASASFVEQYKYPVLFRNHDKPNKENVINFRSILSKLGLSLSGDEIPKSIHYSNLLNQISNRPDYEMIQIILLRSMKQAVYSPENRGHFGLSLSSYVHFTSPIRRYPDLLLHRTIKHLLCKKNKKFLNKNYLLDSNLFNVNEIKKIGEHCSITERRSDKATRDVIDWLKCDFMEKKIGHVFTGVISNITAFGFFVRLNDFFIDGLVHIATLVDDCYYFDSVELKLIGKLKCNTYSLGDALTVKVIGVHFNERKIELSLYKSF